MPGGHLDTFHTFSDVENKDLCGQCLTDTVKPTDQPEDAETIEEGSDSRVKERHNPTQVIYFPVSPQPSLV